MKTAVFTDVNKIQFEEVERPVVTPDKILITVNACAICTWEQRVYTGVKKVDFPFIGGHEISGEIIDIGSNIDNKIWGIGDKVVYGTNLACGDCYFCKKGEEQNCLYFDHSKHLEGLPHKGMGGFSEYMLVEPKHIFKYDNVSSLEASLTEPVSCVIHSVETADVKFGDIVVIIGCGIMGQLHIQLAKRRGATVIASDMNVERLKQAKKMGADYTNNPDENNLKELVNEVSDEIGAQVVFDTTPISKVAEESVDLLSNLGKLVLYSSFYPDNPIEISPDTLHKKATQIVGTANSNSRDFTEAAKMISEKTINVSDFIDEVYPFDDIENALESAVKGDKYRVVVEFNK